MTECPVSRTALPHRPLDRRSNDPPSLLQYWQTTPQSMQTLAPLSAALHPHLAVKSEPARRCTRAAFHRRPTTNPTFIAAFQNRARSLNASRQNMMPSSAADACTPVVFCSCTRPGVSRAAPLFSIALQQQQQLHMHHAAPLHESTPNRAYCSIGAGYCNNLALSSAALIVDE